MTTADVEDIFELTPLQHGMLFHSIAEPEASMYFEQVCFDLPGALNLAKFRHTWAILVDRHQILRTSFFWNDLERPLQVVHRRATIDITLEDWSHLSAHEVDARFHEFLRADRRRGVQLERAPLMRISLFRVGRRHHRFVASFHHALLDGWSLGNLFTEFGLVYEALVRNGPYPLGSIPPYGDFIRWLQEQDPAVAEAHWRRVLSGYDGPPPLSFDPADRSAFGEAEVHLDESATSRLSEVAGELKVTSNTVVQGALGQLLWRYTGEPDIVFGAVVSGRPPSLPGVESMIGLFINTIPVRVRIDPEHSVADQLVEIQEQQLVGIDHSYVSLVEIQGWSDVPRGVPLFNTLLIFENHPMAMGNGSSPPVDAAAPTAHERTNYPITVLVSPGSRLGLKVQCVGASEGTATSIAHHLVTLLEAIGRGPNRPMASLSMHTAPELTGLVELAQGSRVDREFAGLHELFERQVAATPTSTAVSGSGRAWTYEQLAARSLAVAAQLSALDVGPGDAVGVFGARTPLLASILLGVLQSGAAFLPLDTSSPAQRTTFMVSDSGARVVLASRDVAHLLPAIDAEVFVVGDELPDEMPDALGVPAPPRVASEDVAYVIYTSGSTGRPKGIVQTHGATVNRFQWMWDAFPFHPGEVACQKTALTFVDSVWEILGPLLRGVPVQFIDEHPAADPDRFIDELGQARVTRLLVVPSLLAVLLESEQSLRARLPDLELCVCSGEPLPQDLAQRFTRSMPQTTLVNLYGSSEVAADVTAAVMRERDDVEVTIGRPIDNVATYVLDDRLEPVAVGVPGEIHVGGIALAHGYLGRPGLTAERFVPDPFAEGGRLFRTGDRARWRPDGQLEFLGRRDHQIKLRGVRVELGEVEAALTSCPGVEQAIVTVVDEHTPRANLLARVVTNDSSASESAIRNTVADRLPAVMVPALIEIVDSLPLLPNGKLDRLSITRLPTQAGTARTVAPPTTDTERTLAALWQEVLGVPITDRHMNFFSLGGHSLTVMQVGSRIRRVFDVEVPLGKLFDASTLTQQAAVIDHARADGSRPGGDSIRRLVRTAASVPPLADIEEQGGVP